MLFFFMVISLLMSMYLVSLKHPLSMGLTLLIQTIIVSLTIGVFSSTYWFSYILFLTMIGGMLVLFIYMTSVASNELFKYSTKLMMLTCLILFSSLIIYMFIDKMLPYTNNITLESINLMNNMNFSLSMNKYLMYPTNLIYYMIIIYLLITLIAVVKITNIKQGPLRQMN